MHVGMDVEMIGVSAVPMEEGSIVELDMPEKLLPGENLVVVTVTALSGNVNTYIIKVYREEQDDILEDTVTEDTEADTISDTKDQTSTEAATEITTEGPTTEIDKTTETVNPEIPVEENSTEE